MPRRSNNATDIWGTFPDDLRLQVGERLFDINLGGVKAIKLID